MAIFQELLDPADECTTILQNAGQYLTNNKAWQPKRLNTFKNENLFSMIRIKLHISLDIQLVTYHYTDWAIPAHRFSEFCLKLLALFRFFMHLLTAPSQHTNQDMMHRMWHTSNYRMILAAPQWTCPPTQRFDIFWDVMLCCEVSGNQHF